MPATKKLYAYYPTTGLWLPLVGNATGQLVIDASNLFEDTPTDGETKKGPTSNWAYDHNAAKTGVHQAGANNLATDADIATHAALDTGVHGAGGETLLNTGDLEDTPTDGETDKAPTSNWAYDHNAAKTGVHGAGGDVLATDADIATHAALDTGVHGSGGEVLLNTGDLEDSPSSGESDKAPTSAWAYLKDQIRASRFSAYANATQELETNQNLGLNLDTELYDNLNEFDVTNKTGTATSTSANHLVDSGAGFTSDDLGAWVWNTTDDTTAYVTAVNSGTDLTLSRDIMVNGETYRLFRSWFKPATAGHYAFVGVFRISGGDVVANTLYVVKVYKNNAHVAQVVQHAAYAGSLNIGISWQGYVLTTDKISLGCYQNSGATVTAHIAGQSNETIFQGHRFA